MTMRELRHDDHEPSGADETVPADTNGWYGWLGLSVFAVLVIALVVGV